MKEAAMVAGMKAPQGLFLIKADLATAADPCPTSQYQWLIVQYGNMLQ